MLWTPQKGPIRQERLGGVVPTTGATASTKGAWLEFDASTAFEVYGLWLFITDYSAAATDARLAVDIGIGASTAESVLIADLLCGNA